MQWSNSFQGSQTVANLILKILFLVPSFMNPSEAKFYENFLNSDSHINTIIFETFCFPIKMAFKQVIFGKILSKMTFILSKV